MRSHFCDAPVAFGCRYPPHSCGGGQERKRGSGESVDAESAVVAHRDRQLDPDTLDAIRRVLQILLDI